MTSGTGAGSFFRALLGATRSVRGARKGRRSACGAALVFVILMLPGRHGDPACRPEAREALSRRHVTATRVDYFEMRCSCRSGAVLQLKPGSTKTR
jgi:hypothetical protein